MDSPINKIIIGISLILAAMSGWAYYLKPGPPEGGKQKLDWYTADNLTRKATVERFNELHPEYYLKMSNLHSNRSTLQKVVVECSSGVGPDVFDINGNTMLEYCIEAGIAWDITDQADQYHIGKNEMWPEQMKDMCRDGRQYGYPTSGAPSVLIYNKNVFDDFHVPYPKPDITWDEMIEIAKKVTKLSKNPADSIFGVQGFRWDMILASFRGQFFNPDGTRILVDSEPMRKAFQMHIDMRFKEHVTPSDMERKSMATHGGSSFTTRDLFLFADGKIAMLSIGQWSLSELRRIYQDREKAHQKWEANPNRDPAREPKLLRLGCIMHPHEPGYPPSFRSGSRTSVINAMSPNREKALRLLEYLASREQCEIANGGEMPPGNPQYADVGFHVEIPELGEEEIHRNTLRSLERSYSFDRSPFLLTLEVERILSDQMSRIESDPSLRVEDVLKEAQEELERLMQKNIDRIPELRKKYKTMTGVTDVQQVRLNASSPESILLSHAK